MPDVKWILSISRVKFSTGEKIIVPCSKEVHTGLWMMPLTNSIEDATYEMVHSHKVCRTSLNGQILPNQNISDVVKPGMASEVAEFEFAKIPTKQQPKQN